MADPNPRAQAFYRKHDFVADGPPRPGRDAGDPHGPRQAVPAVVQLVVLSRWQQQGRCSPRIESHVVAEGDLVVQFGRREDLSVGGTFRGFEVPADIYARDAAFAYRLVDGRIAERWAIRDDLAMMGQLGALKPRPGKP